MYKRTFDKYPPSDNIRLYCRIQYGMKKICAVLAAIMTAATVWFFCACNADGMENVSERRSNYFTSAEADGGSSGMTVVAVSGVRETPYTLDGRAEKLKPYTLITVVPTEFDVDAVYTYKAVTPSGEFGGTLAVHPFAASYSAEFESETTGAFTVEVKLGSAAAKFEMTTLVTDDMLDCARAVAAAKSELKPTGEYEIRARIIKNPIETDPIVCWHVSFYTADGKQCGVLLDPATAKVLAKQV